MSHELQFLTLNDSAVVYPTYDSGAKRIPEKDVLLSKTAMFVPISEVVAVGLEVQPVTRPIQGDDHLTGNTLVVRISLREGTACEATGQLARTWYSQLFGNAFPLPAKLDQPLALWANQHVQIEIKSKKIA